MALAITQKNWKSPFSANLVKTKKYLVTKFFVTV